MPPKGDIVGAAAFEPPIWSATRIHRSADGHVRMNTPPDQPDSDELPFVRPLLADVTVSAPFGLRRRGLLRAFTVIEVMVILAIIAILVFLLLPALARVRAEQRRKACVNHLKDVGLACRISQIVPDEFPWRLEQGREGTSAFANDPAAAWRHFAALSNELRAPKIVSCPSDRERPPAKAWSDFTNNRFLSYTVGLSASEDRPQSVLSGDRNLLLDGVPLSNVVVSFRSNANVAFDRRIHVEVGNLLLGDGSVQQVTSGRLRDQFRDAFQAVGTDKVVIP